MSPSGAQPGNGVSREEFDLAIDALRRDQQRAESAANRAENIANSVQGSIDPIRRQLADLTASHRSVEGKLSVLPSFTSSIGAQLTAVVAGCLATTAIIVSALRILK